MAFPLLSLDTDGLFKRSEQEKKRRLHQKIKKTYDIWFQRLIAATDGKVQEEVYSIYEDAMTGKKDTGLWDAASRAVSTDRKGRIQVEHFEWEYNQTADYLTGIRNVWMKFWQEQMIWRSDQGLLKDRRWVDKIFYNNSPDVFVSKLKGLSTSDPVHETLRAQDTANSLQHAVMYAAFSTVPGFRPVMLPAGVASRLAFKSIVSGNVAYWERTKLAKVGEFVAESMGVGVGDVTITVEGDQMQVDVIFPVEKQEVAYENRERIYQSTDEQLKTEELGITDPLVTVALKTVHVVDVMIDKKYSPKQAWILISATNENDLPPKELARVLARLDFSIPASNDDRFTLELHVYKQARLEQPSLPQNAVYWARLVGQYLLDAFGGKGDTINEHAEKDSDATTIFDAGKATRLWDHDLEF